MFSSDRIDFLEITVWHIQVGWWYNMQATYLCSMSESLFAFYARPYINYLVKTIKILCYIYQYDYSYRLFKITILFLIFSSIIYVHFYELFSIELIKEEKSSILYGNNCLKYLKLLINFKAISSSKYKDKVLWFYVFFLAQQTNQINKLIFFNFIIFHLSKILLCYFCIFYNYINNGFLLIIYIGKINYS